MVVNMGDFCAISLQFFSLIVAPVTYLMAISQ